MSLQPHPHDVLFGKSGLATMLSGNVSWRKKVDANKEEYVKLGKRRNPAKMRIIAQRHQGREEPRTSRPIPEKGRKR
eukprot:scaffold3955_cov160-Cylindrotheca_fusiformis.AAC.20